MRVDALEVLMSERDPLDLLQNAWQTMPSEDATPSLEDSDSLTQDTVTWMAEAWQQMEIPAAELPKRQRILSWRSLTVMASAAAALLISALILLNWSDQDGKDLEPHHVTVNGVEQDQPEVPVEPSDPTNGATAQPDKTAAPKLLAATPERVEVLSGRVRLTMLTPGPASDSQSTDS